MLTKGQKFADRAAISSSLGGSTQYGITRSSKFSVILLFMNDDELYNDYFYPKGKRDKCLYTGIGRIGNQDNVTDNKSYYLNLDVLSSGNTKTPLLLFEKQKSGYHFVGEYKLIETHQNIQPDDNQKMRRVFVFHLERVESDLFDISPYTKKYENTASV